MTPYLRATKIWSAEGRSSSVPQIIAYKYPEHVHRCHVCTVTPLSVTIRIFFFTFSPDWRQGTKKQYIFLIRSIADPVPSFYFVTHNLCLILGLYFYLCQRRLYEMYNRRRNKNDREWPVSTIDFSSLILFCFLFITYNVFLYNFIFIKFLCRLEIGHGFKCASI